MTNSEIKITKASLQLVDDILRFEKVRQSTGEKSGFQMALESTYMILNGAESLENLMAVMFPERYENGYLYL